MFETIPGWGTVALALCGLIAGNGLAIAIPDPKRRANVAKDKAPKEQVLKPLGNYVVVKRLAEDKTPGGILLPQTQSSARPRYATVVAAGPGTIEEPIHLEVGQVVMVHPDAGWILPGYSDQEHSVVTINEIFAVVES